MKVCNMCGSQLQDNYNACPNCGNTNLSVAAGQAMPGQPIPGQAYQQPGMPQQGYQQPMYGQQVPGPNVQKVNTKGNFGWAVLGFLIPIVGWILYFVWKNTKPGDAKMAGIGGICGFCFNLIIQFL